MWYERCEWLKNRSWGLRMFIIVLIAFIYPLLPILYLLAPNTKMGNFVRTPCIKFVAETASFFTFLAVIVGNSFADRHRLCDPVVKDHSEVNDHWQEFRHSLNLTYFNIESSDLCVRTYAPDPMHLMISVWISALLWQECKQLYGDGVSAHFSSVYNHMDFFMLNFYIASLAVRFLAYFKTYSALMFFKDRVAWKHLVANSPMARYMAYWLISDRFYWDTWDPCNVSEALYSVANILTFARLFYLLAINEHLGPLLISLERMIKDVMKFMVTFLLIFLAFMVGLHNLYWYYEPSIRAQVEFHDHHILTRAEKGFGTLELTFRTVFWALFGLSDARVVELGKGSRIPQPVHGFQSRVTESVGYIVFGVYNWGAVIVLLNMLIAMMTRSFEKITREQDVEWKFARSKLYMEYIKEGSTLPVPFNIIPSPKSIITCVKHCCRSVRMSASNRRRDCWKDCEQEMKEVNGILGRTIGKHYLGAHEGRAASARVEPEEESVFLPLNHTLGSKTNSSLDSNTLDYKSVIKKVVRRYIFERLQSSVGANDGDLDHIRITMQGLQEDLRSEHRQLDQLSMQHKQVTESVDILKQSVTDMESSISLVHNKLDIILQFHQQQLQQQVVPQQAKVKTQLPMQYKRRPLSGVLDECAEDS